MKKPIGSVIDYLALCLLFSTSIIFLIYFNGVVQSQRLVVIFTALTYIIWGYVHHKREKTYNIKIELEYIVYAVLGSVLIMGLL